MFIKKCIYSAVFVGMLGAQMHAASNIQDLKQLSDGGVHPKELKTHLQKTAPQLVQFIGSLPTRLDTQLYTTLAQAKTAVIVKFYLTGCGPCKQMGRIVEKVANEFGDSILVINIELTDTTRYLMEAFNALGVPTLIFFEDGQKVDQFTGPLTASELTSKIKSIVN